MDFVENVNDLGAPEYYVTGLAAAEKISASHVRLTKYSRRRDGNIVVFHEVWDIHEWVKSQAIYAHLLEMIERLPAPDGVAGDPRRERH